MKSIMPEVCISYWKFYRPEDEKEYEYGIQETIENISK